MELRDRSEWLRRGAAPVYVGPGPERERRGRGWSGRITCRWVRKCCVEDLLVLPAHLVCFIVAYSFFWDRQFRTRSFYFKEGSSFFAEAHVASQAGKGS